MLSLSLIMNIVELLVLIALIIFVVVKLNDKDKSINDLTNKVNTIRSAISIGKGNNLVVNGLIDTGDISIANVPLTQQDILQLVTAENLSVDGKPSYFYSQLNIDKSKPTVRHCIMTGTYQYPPPTPNTSHWQGAQWVTTYYHAGSGLVQETGPTVFNHSNMPKAVRWQNKDSNGNLLDAWTPWTKLASS